MLLRDFADRDIHALPKARVTKENQLDLPACHTVKRVVELSDLTPVVRRDLNALMDAAGRQTAEFLALLERRSMRRYCIGNAYRTLRDQLVADHYVSPFGLQARLWKTALQFASNIWERHWRAVQENARSDIRKSAWFQRALPAEQHFVHRMLFKLSDDFFEMLDGRSPIPKGFDASGIPRRKSLCDQIRRAVRRAMKKAPRHGATRSMCFDEGCWSSREADGVQYIDLMSLTPRKRIALTLKGKSRLHNGLNAKGEARRGTITLVRDGDGLAVHVLKPLKSARPNTIPAVADDCWYVTGQDMGFTEVFTTDKGNAFGEGLGIMTRRIFKERDEKLQKRNALRDLAKNTTDAKKRSNIERFNLGTKKDGIRRRKAKLTIECTVNYGLNRMFERNPADVYVIENLSESFENKLMNRETRGALSNWCRRQIRERLLYKAAQIGAKVIHVNPAYTSQRCPHCGYTDRKNRNGDKWRCLACGSEMQSDTVGAVNILLRAHESGVTRYMSTDSVYKRCRDEYETRCRKDGITPLPDSHQK